MKIQTFSIPVGNAACDASCPYCISQMTPVDEEYTSEINWRNFGKACRLAKICGTTTVLLTGKGEPTLHPKEISSYLGELMEYGFPMIELQTNGLAFDTNRNDYKKHLSDWYRLGLSMVAISVVHYNPDMNQRIFTPKKKYMDLPGVVARLHGIGFSVRLSCLLLKNYVDNPMKVRKMIETTRDWGVEQLSLRDLAVPDCPADEDVAKWANAHRLRKDEMDEIKEYVKANGHQLMTLENGSVIYDVFGQNVCMTDALTIEPDADSLRQIIFFPGGHVKYDWQHKGAILI